MSNQFQKEAAEILNNAATPDAEASTIKEAPENAGDVPQKSKRGRKPGGKNKTKKSGNDGGAKYSQDEFDASAKAINTIIFSVACGVCGTSEAWPSDDKAAAMDKAAARYMELKGWVAPPEAILLQVYAQYISELSNKPIVQENFVKRFGGWKTKIPFVQKFLQKRAELKAAKLQKLGKEK